jgi:hypothetical protein
MPRQTPLEKQWDELMFLCGREKQFQEEKTHRVLLTVLKRRIDELAREMGFGENQIETRDFRAERVDGRIVSIEKK